MAKRNIYYTYINKYIYDFPVEKKLCRKIFFDTPCEKDITILRKPSENQLRKIVLCTRRIEKCGSMHEQEDDFQIASYDFFGLASILRIRRYQKSFSRTCIEIYYFSYVSVRFCKFLVRSCRK